MSTATLTKCVIGFKSVPIQIALKATGANGQYQSMVSNMLSAIATGFNTTQTVAVCSLSPAFSITSAGTTTTTTTTTATTTNGSTEVVLLDRHGDKGVITLNRPKALNAITNDMAIKIGAKIRSWVSDSEMGMVVMKSSSEKAFCVGGDIKKICTMGPEEGKRSFRFEYPLINLIGSSSAPFVALIDGLVMGAGCGISVNGKFRVASERALFSMPETAIGLFPDVGASHFLNKLPGSLGLYLGLTGHRLRGRDLFEAGIATHFVPSNKLKVLEDDLMQLERPDSIRIDEILQKHQQQWQADEHMAREFSLKPHLGRINGIFGQANRVEDIISGLERDDSEWAREHLNLLAKMSPTSLKLTFEQLRRAKSLSLAECLKMEFRMVCRVLDGNEFGEGVRAILIDRDDRPRWNPARLEEVREADINAYFEPLPDNLELQL